MKTIGVLLVTVALVAGMVGCQADSDTEPTPTMEYSLTISSSNGGKVTTPGEGVFTYEQGAVVELVAQPEEGHLFLNWTGDTDTVDAVEAAETIITMEGDYEITASFGKRCVEQPGWNTPGVCYQKPKCGPVEIGMFFCRYRTSNRINGGYEEDEDAWVDLECGHYYGNECSNDPVKECSDTIYKSIGPNPEENDCYASGEAACRYEVEAMSCSGKTNQVEGYFNVGWQLDVSSSDGGSVTTPGEGESYYEYDEVVDLVATPYGDAQFVRWTGDVATISDIEAAETTITMQGDHEITASFARRCLDPPDYNMPGICYQKPKCGPVEIGVGFCRYRISNRINGDYEENAWVDLECGHYYGNECFNDPVKECSDTIYISMGPNPEENDCYVSGEAACRYAVYGMSCSGSEDSKEYFFNVGWQLIASSTDGGSVTTPSEEDSPFYYEYDEVVDLVATPETGYQFENWTGDIGTIADPNSANTTITMEGGYSITANFEVIQHTLTIDSTTGGSVTTPGQGTFTHNHGAVVNLMANPDTGYQFANWTGDVVTVGDVKAAETTIAMDGNHSIMANFRRPVNRALIGGVIAAVVAVGLAVFLLRRRRRSEAHFEGR